MGTGTQIFLICFAPALFWLVYFLYHAKYGKTGARVLLAMFFAGMVAGPIALGLFHLIESVPFYRNLTQLDLIEEESVRFAYCSFDIGPIEEFSKFFVVWLLMYRREEFSSPIDGLTFAAAAALGFASIENWYFLTEDPEILESAGEIVLASAITLPFVHMLFSSFWGVGLSFSKFARTPAESRVLFIGLPLAFIFHGIYDYITLSEQVPVLLVLPLVFILWLWLSLSLRRLSQKGPLNQAFSIAPTDEIEP
jgi:RsiW-degrading membrane proteinase PrsW (M82 family)